MIKRKKTTLSFLVFILALLICIFVIPNLEFTKSVKVNKIINSEAPIAVTLIPEYDGLQKVSVHLSDSLAGNDDTLTVQLLDAKDNVVYKNDIPASKISNYKKCNVVSDFQFEKGKTYHLVFQTHDTSDIFSRVYIYSLVYKYKVPVSRIGYILYYFIVYFVAALIFWRIFKEK